MADKRWTFFWWADKAASLYAFAATSLTAYFIVKAVIARWEELSAGILLGLSIFAVGLCVAAWRSI